MGNIAKRLQKPFKKNEKLEKLDDNFCGFYHAVTRSINAVLGKDLAVKDLKKDICDYAKNYDWVKEIVIEKSKKNPSSSTKISAIWDNYLSNFETNEIINPEIEGQIICNVYSIKIHILQNKDEDWSKGAITELRPNEASSEEDVIHVINNGDNSYVSCFQEHCCPQAMLEERLENFVIKFVEEFQAKLALYKLIMDGEVVKAGKFANTYAELIGQGAGGAIFGTIGFFLGIPGIAAEVGKELGKVVSKEIASKIGSENHKEKVRNLSETVNYFHKFPKHFLKILVRVALDIFQSYEMQFGRVSSDVNEKPAMHLLAIDAMNKAINYMSIYSSEKIDFHSFILNGVKFGKSKADIMASISIPGKKDGFNVEYKYGLVNLKWKTGDLYENVGLVVFEDEEIKYFIKEDFKNFFEYGFRRCFTYENYKELTGYKCIEIDDKIEQFSGYSYVFKQEDIMLKVDHFCNKIREKENNFLDENRLKEIITQFKIDYFEELTFFKSIINDPKKLNCCKNDLKILETIQSNIENIKIEEYKDKLSQILQNVQDIKKDIQEVNENVSQLAENSKTIIDKVDNLTDKIDVLSAQNNFFNDKAIWFNLREKPLTLAIKRVKILEEIAKDDENNVIVLYGLGGMGKSELAINYAQTHFNKDQNVIWINSESTESFIGSCFRLAQLVKVDTKDFKRNEECLEVIFTEIFRNLSNRKSLFIFDNAENYNVIKPLLTKITTGNKSIITSRQDSDWDKEWESFRIIRVGVFEDFEAIPFVKKYLPAQDNDYSDADIEQLLNVLGSYPLALTHALIYIKKNNSLRKKLNQSFTIADYVLKFENDPKTLMEAKIGGEAYPTSIFKVLELTLENLEKETFGEDALLILKNISFMVPNNISEKLFSINIKNSDELPNVIGLLDSYSLVNVINGNLSVHRLVQDTVKMVMENSEKTMILCRLLQALIDQSINWKTNYEYLLQVILIWKFASEYEELIEKFIINEIGNKRACMPFLHLIASCEKLDLFKDIINTIKSKYPNQLKKVIENKDDFQRSVLHLLGHNMEMRTFLRIQVPEASELPVIDV